MTRSRTPGHSFITDIANVSNFSLHRCNSSRNEKWRKKINKNEINNNNTNRWPLKCLNLFYMYFIFIFFFFVFIFARFVHYSHIEIVAICFIHLPEPKKHFALKQKKIRIQETMLFQEGFFIVNCVIWPVEEECEKFIRLVLCLLMLPMYNKCNKHQTATTKRKLHLSSLKCVQRRMKEEKWKKKRCEVSIVQNWKEWTNNMAQKTMSTITSMRGENN